MSDYIYNKVYRVPETLFLPTFLHENKIIVWWNLHENKIIVLWNLHENKIIPAAKILKKRFAPNNESLFCAKWGKKVISRRIVMGNELLVVEMCEKTMDFHD